MLVLKQCFEKYPDLPHAQQFWATAGGLLVELKREGYWLYRLFQVSLLFLKANFVFDFSFSRLSFFVAARLMAFASAFSSSESDAKSSLMYSFTVSQLSLSANQISLTRFITNFLPSSIMPFAFSVSESLSCVVEFFQ